MEKELTFEQLCLSVRDLSRAIDLIVESLNLLDHDDATRYNQRKAARALAIKTRDKINAHLFRDNGHNKL